MLHNQLIDILAHIQEVKEALSKGETTVRVIDENRDATLEECLGMAQQKIEELLDVTSKED